MSTTYSKEWDIVISPPKILFLPEAQAVVLFVCNVIPGKVHNREYLLLACVGGSSGKTISYIYLTELYFRYSNVT